MLMTHRASAIIEKVSFVIILALCLALLLPIAAFGQTATKVEAATVIVSAALPPELIELRRAGNAAAYNLDYAGARAKFEELRKRAPQHPAGDLYIATIIWLEHLYRS